MKTNLKVTQGNKIIEHSSMSKADLDTIKQSVAQARQDSKFAGDVRHVARIPEFVVNEIFHKHGINLLKIDKRDQEQRARFMSILRTEYPHLIVQGK